MKTPQLRHLSAALLLFAAACTGANGQDGKNCSVTDNGDGSATIACPDGSSTRVNSGTSGQNGTNGTNGMAGTSCTVTSDADAGTKTIACTDGTSVTLKDGTNGANGVDANFWLDFSKLTADELAKDDFSVTVQSVSNAPRPVVRFVIKNSKGVGMFNVPPSYIAGIALLQLVPGTPVVGGNGLNIDTWVSHITNCATCTSSTESANATSLVDNKDGSYVYTFAKDVVNPTPYDGGMAIAGVAFDANAAHRFALRFADPANDAEGNKANSFRPVDVTYDYIPATGQNIDGQNDKVNTANCLTCHTQWRAGALNVGGLVPFHGGQRYDVRYCVVCHNDQRKYSGNNIAGNAVIPEPSIDAGTLVPPGTRTNISVFRGEAIINLPVFIHKIHAGEFLTYKGNYAGIGTEVNEFSFPQDLRNCTKCHSKAVKADNWLTKPSRRACGSCHDNVNFATGEGHAAPLNLARLDDNTCNLCHDVSFSSSRHFPVTKPDPNNALVKPGGSANTHASWVGNPNNPPDGGRAFSYDVKSVTVTDGGPTGVYPVVRFRFVEGDAGVVFNSYDGGNELIDNFVGSPSVYCVFSMPQDGVDPADFNASMSAYLRTIWAGGSGGKLTGPDSQGYYSATLTAGRLPPTAKQLTCGLGYTYSVPSTLPLTQVNLPAYPYNAMNKSGGLSLPAKNQWAVAQGYTGRRGTTSSTSQTGKVVTSERCENCHAQVGVAPNYHAGQRNDPATCSFCHTSNRTSSGWTAGSGSFIHAIHAAKKRTVPFNWHAVAATEDHPFATGFWGVEYPARLNACETCHNPGTYDLSGPWYTEENLARRTVQTVATGRYDAVTPTADGGLPALAASVSPYVISDGSYDYDGGYSYAVATQQITPAAGSTLVISPIANNCFGCHDDPISKLHMETNGASIYEERIVAATKTEQCMVCHGPGRIAGIKAVHSK